MRGSPIPTTIVRAQQWPGTPAHSILWILQTSANPPTIVLTFDSSSDLLCLVKSDRFWSRWFWQNPPTVWPYAYGADNLFWKWKAPCYVIDGQRYRSCIDCLGARRIIDRPRSRLIVFFCASHNSSLTTRCTSILRDSYKQ